MNRTEAAKILAVLTAAYPNAYKNMSPDEANGVVSIWAIQFADSPADIVFMALNKAISSCKYPPTISEIKARLYAMHWEAYEALSRNEIAKADESLNAAYQRIYDCTSQYQASSKELSLGAMLSSGSMKFLE